VLLILFATNDDSLWLQRETILEDREKKATTAKEHMAQLQKQVTGHESGERHLEGTRYSSLMQRIQAYKGQLYEFSQPLSDKVRLRNGEFCFGPKVCLTFGNLDFVSTGDSRHDRPRRGIVDGF
jgi:hypothetical protein